jgi:hypothetical protein
MGKSWKAVETIHQHRQTISLKINYRWIERRTTLENTLVKSLDQLLDLDSWNLLLLSNYTKEIATPNLVSRQQFVNTDIKLLTVTVISLMYISQIGTRGFEPPTPTTPK